jgi:high-affinity nickel permease
MLMNLPDTSITGALSLGFLLGLRHALDSDHLVAVSAIVSEHKSLARSSLVGTFWGLGHTVSLFAVGLIILLLKISIPEHVKPWMEMPVALMLVALGINATFRAARDKGWQIHTHVHSHDQQSPHAHVHIHSTDEHNHKHRLFRLGRRPFLVGLVHGFAGSAAVALAALATVPTIALGLTWIAVFGIGSIGGMLLMSATISLPFIVTARRFSAINGTIRLLAGLFSIIFGLTIAWSLFSEIGGANS